MVVGAIGESTIQGNAHGFFILSAQVSSEVCGVSASRWSVAHRYARIPVQILDCVGCICL
jgi:hypothetical protein